MPDITENEPAILLLQARTEGDPILEHEFECFVDRVDCSTEAFHAVNMVTDGIEPGLLDEFDAVMVGGAGDFSIVEGDFEWYEPLMETMRAVIDRGVPMFASCFGFHALVAALGGRLAHSSERSEVGTFEIRLTDAGRKDSFFGQFPDRFDAQLGHKDSVDELPSKLVRLAESERCQIQAVRVPGEPIFATQFHPELSAADNIERYARYLQNYKGAEETHDEAMERAERIHRESPVANGLLEKFLESFVEPYRDAVE